MANDLIWNIDRDDSLKSAILTNLKRCEIELGQMEIMALEVHCNFEAGADEPDPVSYKVAVCSQEFQDDMVKDELEWLINSNELEELRKRKSELKAINNCDAADSIDKSREFEAKRSSFWKGFIERIKEKLICIPKAQDYQGQRYLFLLAELAQDTYQYREILEYVLDEVCTSLETIDAISSFSSSAYFSYKMPNKRVLLGNYVDYFLKKYKLPPAAVLIELSAEKYEGSESEARIYFDCQSVTELGILDEMGKESRIIRSDNRRMIRKMMEISKEGSIHLYAERKSEGENRFCLITKLAKEYKKHGLYIRFFGYLCWSVVCDKKEKIIYERGQYILNSSKHRMEYISKIEELKKNVGVSSMPKKLLRWFEESWMQDLIEILKKQKHGTAVILTNCHKEAERLCRVNRGILINEDRGICRNDDGWNQEQILSVTNIDGALFMDLNGVCMAIGVIVDGKAVHKGDTGKGARYNSIVNYVKQKNKSSIYVGIIVSEDEMIELVCNLESDKVI